MNNKQLLPLIAKLGLFGGIIWVVSTIFSDNDAETKPASDPLKTEPDNQRKPAENSWKETEIPAKPAAVPVSSARAPVVTLPVKTVERILQSMAIPPDSAGKSNSGTVFPVNFVENEPEILIPTIPPVFSTDIPTVKTEIPANRRNLITREHMAAIFDQGKILLNRKTAAELLKELGFGKSAAYEALSPDGRFSAYLYDTPDGMISWED